MRVLRVEFGAYLEHKLCGDVLFLLEELAFSSVEPSEGVALIPEVVKGLGEHGDL